MNIFGLFFSFMIPGIIIGMGMMIAALEGAKKRGMRRKAARGMQTLHTVRRDRLYIASVADPACGVRATCRKEAQRNKEALHAMRSAEGGLRMDLVFQARNKRPGQHEGSGEVA